MSVMTNI